MQQAAQTATSKMALISPALVLAMVVMFILSRVHSVRFTFEHLFFFGLRYVVEPSRAQLASLAATGMQGAIQAMATAGRGGKKAAAVKKAKETAAKPSITSLPISRAVLTPAFFATEEEIPHLQHFDHLLATTIGYVVGVTFEEISLHYFPNLFGETHIWWLAVFAVVFAMAESLRICFEHESAVAPLIVAAASALIALGLIAAGDLGRFIHFDKAFGWLTMRAGQTFLEKLDYDLETANVLAGNVTLTMQVVVAVSAGAAVAASLFPAFCFARLDYALFSDFVRSDDARKQDQYALGPRRLGDVLLVALDHLLALAATTAWLLSPRDAAGVYGGWRIGLLLMCSFARFLCLRLRLQLHLDSAIDAFRAFWREKAALGVVQAGERLKDFVAHKAVHVSTIAMAGIVSPVIVTVLALTAKRSGGISFGVFKAPEGTVIPRPFVRELAGFVAVAHLASYSCFVLVGWIYIALTQAFDPLRAQRDQKVMQPMTSSERRRRRRNMEAAAQKNSTD